jgi:Pectate lyase superfamily protein
VSSSESKSQRRAVLAGLAGATFAGSVVGAGNVYPNNSTKAVGSAPDTFDAFSQRPRGLTAADAGRTLLFTETGNFHRWSGTAWEVLNESVINVKDYGAVGDSIADDTQAIRLAIDRASDFYRQTNGAYPLSYGPTDSGTVLFPHGNYRITDTITVSNGLTVTGESDLTYTVGRTRIIMDTRDSASKESKGGKTNLDKHIFKFTLGILFGDGVVRNPNPNLTIAIADLEFWVMNPGALIGIRQGEGWPNNPQNDNLGVYGACCIYIDVPCIDSRIKRCNFYSTPNAAICFNQANSTVVSSCIIEECEFDTCITGILCASTQIELTVSDSEFWTSSYGVYVTNCTGNIQLTGNQWLQNSPVSIKNNCRITSFLFSGNLVNTAANAAILSLHSCDAINVSSNTFSGNAFWGAIAASNCNGGVITANSITDSGRGYTGGQPGGELASAAVIRLYECNGIVVSANSITTPAVDGTYNGFGILAVGSASRASRCLVTNNVVSSKYNAYGESATLYRNQNRWINVSATDQTLAGNFVV